MTDEAEVRLDVQLVLGPAPHVEILLSSAGNAVLPARLVIDLPGPLAEDRPEGRFVADPRVPESEVALRWGEDAGEATPHRTLTVSAGEHSWTLRQDRRFPDRWSLASGQERWRHWS